MLIFAIIFYKNNNAKNCNNKNYKIPVISGDFIFCKIFNANICNNVNAKNGNCKII